MRGRIDSIGLPVAEIGRRGAWSATGSWPREVDRAGSVTLTGNVSSNVKGAWTEMIAATAAATDLIALFITGLAASGAQTNCLIDIGVGASGSETVIAGDVAIGGASNYSLTVPVFIPLGSRVAARIQTGISADTLTAIATTYASDLVRHGQQTVPTWGANTSTSEGTAMSSTADTYVEVIAATDWPLSGVVLVPSLATNAASNTSPTITLAVGPSGSELAIGSIVAVLGATETIQYATSDKSSGIIAAALAEGSRLAAKATSGGSGLRVSIIGIPVS